MVWIRCALPALSLLSGGTISAEGDPNPALRFACTGFAVYTGEPIYGMNFDYPPRELRFRLISQNERLVFRMEFPQEGVWYSTVGMNSDGVFSSVQMLFPEWPAVQAGPDQMYLWRVSDYALEETSSASQTMDLLSSRHVVEGQTSLHTIIADPQGNAFVLEPGRENNRITPIQGKSLLMTNFPLADFAGKESRQMQGVGADRYQKAWAYIAETLDRFDTTQAFETLHRAQNDGGSPTLCSMVFLPNRREVFIALNRDFNKLWRVSLRDRTVSTYQGFAGSGELPVTDRGSPCFRFGNNTHAYGIEPPNWKMDSAWRGSRGVDGTSGMVPVSVHTRKREEASMKAQLLSWTGELLTHHSLQKTELIQLLRKQLVPRTREKRRDCIEKRSMDHCISADLFLCWEVARAPLLPSLLLPLLLLPLLLLPLLLRFRICRI